MPVSLKELSAVDWSKCALQIGVEVPGTKNPWIGLDLSELRILKLLLTRMVIPGQGSAATSCEALGKLAEWCEVAIAWCEKRGDT